MTEEQRTAYQNAQTTAAMIEAMGMQANNEHTDNQKFQKEDFDALINKYGLGCNTVQEFLQGH